MKKIYREPEIEVVIFSKQDHIKASSIADTDVKNKAVEDPLAVAQGVADGFFWY